MLARRAWNASVLLHEAAGHPAEHRQPPIRWPEWLSVRDEPPFDVDDAGLDAAKFDACLDSSKYGDRVREGVAQGSRLGVNSTPTMYINGRLVSGAQPYEVIAGVIDEELSRSR